MAEDKGNLDDFFAKRDKKKKSGKNKKFETTEELAKILEKRSEERKKLEEGKSQYVSEEGGPNPTAQTNEDDEWLDHEEKAPDYTGLKIQELVLDDDSETEIIDGKDPEHVVKDGPWRKKDKQGSSPVDPENDGGEVGIATTPQEQKSPEGTDTDESAPTPVVASVPAPAVPATGGKYVPPSQRNLGQPSAASAAIGLSTSNKPLDTSAAGDTPKTYVPPSRRVGASSTPGSVSKPRKPTTAPNLNDEEYFPSLGGS